MKQWAAIGWSAACLASLVASGTGAAHAGAGRFYASPAQCESAHVLTADNCRTAFANALAEFDGKAPRFRSRRACFQAFGPCMPWPLGTRRFDQFRPQWIGVNLDASAGVTPAVAPGRAPLQFAPQPTASLSAAAAAAPARNDTAPTSEAKIMTPRDEDGDETSAPAGRPGGGFTMIDGVLTYPAPARFQPKNLKQP